MSKALLTVDFKKDLSVYKTYLQNVYKSLLSSYIVNFFNRIYDKFVLRSKLNTLQLFARCFAGVSFFYYLFRLLDWNLLYSSQSAIDKDYPVLYFNEFYRPFIYYFPESSWLALAMYGFAMLVFLFSIFRPCHYIFKIIAWFIQIQFFYRNLPGVYGGDLVHNAFFIFFIFSEVKNSQIQKYLISTAKVQVIIIYLASGIAKLQGRTWIEGSAVGLVTANEYLTLFTLDLLKHAPIVSVILSWAVLIFEMGSPFGFTVKKTKKIWISYGIFFHLFTSVYMGLWFFSLKMLMTYVFFIDQPSSASPSQPIASTGQPSKAS